MDKTGAEVALVKGRDGVFEIVIDGGLAFSKQQRGRFPADEEIDALAAGKTRGRSKP